VALVKVAVSIPDDVFDAAEELARRAGTTRSRLYADALRALIADAAATTEALDRVYGADGATDPALRNAGRRAFANSEW